MRSILIYKSSAPGLPLRLHHKERTDQVLIDIHNRPVILELPAVVGRAEYRHHLPAPHELVSLLDHLVRPHYQLQIVLFEELFSDILTKGKADPSFILFPSLPRVGISHIRSHASPLSTVSSGCWMLLISSR